MLIFLPGLICNAQIFAPQLAAFPGARVAPSYGVLNRLDAMARLVLDNAPERFDLFGHSMGGRIALEVVRQAPERVRRLALVSTGVHGVGEGEAQKRHALQAIGYEQGFEALVDHWLPPMLAPDHRDDKAIIDPLRAMCISMGQEVFDAQIAALLARNEAKSLLPSMTCPTLVMTGTLDSWSPPDQHAAMAETLPDARLEIIEGSGHMITCEASKEVNDAITRWLDMPVLRP
ncbi:MAG: alpha/beta fold hydrolase [Sphingomonadaceae bacterium]